MPELERDEGKKKKTIMYAAAGRGSAAPGDDGASRRGANKVCLKKFPRFRLINKKITSAEEGRTAHDALVTNQKEHNLSRIVK